MKWTAFFSEIGKQIDVGKEFYKEFWLESLIFWGVILVLVYGLVYLHAQIRYRRKRGKWFSVRSLWK